MFLSLSNLSAQESLAIQDCTDKEFEINDHSDSDEDGIICEAKITLTNSASYAGEDCNQSAIQWRVFVDFWSDGNIDYEYNSELPSTDNTFDDTNGNSIPDIYVPATSSGETLSIQLEDIEGSFSEHKVSWVVKNDCGLQTSCDYDFTVRDKKAPTPFCVSLTTMIFDGPPFEIYAEDFNVGTFDNCTAGEDIRFSFSDTEIVPTRYITCDDVIKSPFFEPIYFWDESDNIEVCSVHVTVVQEEYVDCFPMDEFFGYIKDWRDEPMEGVTVILDSNRPDFPSYTTTDSTGRYSFGVHQQSTAYNYSISAMKEDTYINLVSTLDLVLNMRHILGLQEFNSPYQIIAADVNGDLIVKANDLLEMRRVILGVTSEFPNVSAWQFFDADFKFENSNNPWPDLSDFESDPKKIEFKLANKDGMNFIGLKTGDVTH